ncbi:GNAT family N-acetyltransferase [Curtobacterium luteum]|uniref:GNAT family N-acetyltransferase n=1 Tax=Curtobacterium luteum TaxID=33881 RepID=UPI0038098A4B
MHPSGATPEGIQVCRLLDEHRDSCVALLSEERYWEFPGAGTAAEEYNRTVSGGYGEFLPNLSCVALHGERVVAFVLVARNTPWVPEDDTQAFITDIVVSPIHRQSGVATALVREVLASAVLEGFKSVSLFSDDVNPAAERLYDGFGFDSSPS